MSNVPMKSSISTKPTAPSVRKFTAHGYIKITSTSNITNKMAVRKYLIENGKRIAFAFNTALKTLKFIAGLSPWTNQVSYYHSSYYKACRNYKLN